MLTWDARWRRFQVWEIVLTSVLTVEAIVMFFLPNGPEGDRWRSGILFDDAARNALVADSADVRSTLSLVSDGLLIALVAYPVLVDTVLTAWLAEDSSDVALQMFALNAEALAITGAMVQTIKRIADRERPVQTACRSNPNYDPDCGSSTRHYSFFSGHASTGFASAGLTCAHHGYLDLYGGGLGDDLACGITVGLAGLVSVLRIVADRHYASDVIVGGAVGFTAGYLMPVLLHYRTADESPAETVTVMALPIIEPSFRGLSVGGLF